MENGILSEQGEALWQRCAAFHGHVCPGLALGYAASRLAMAKLREDSRAEDEELVAVVENDACFVDAVQVLTGCTFGKGNFFHKDYGKIALTLFSRRSGRGVRVSLKGDVLGQDPEHAQLLKKILSGQADAAERARFEQLHAQRTREILGTDPEDLFRATFVDGPVPERARMEPSTPCPRCGEPTMPSKMVSGPSGPLCRGCAEGISRLKD
ncbi:MAG: FmdE family protein [Desulfosoma sp.]